MGARVRNLLAGASVAALAVPWIGVGAIPVEPFVPANEPQAVPGFTLKLRGERVAYCRLERRLGTRIRTETCIDVAQMPAYLAALEENRSLARRFRTGENQIN